MYIKAIFLRVSFALLGIIYLTSCQDLGDPKAFITISQTSFELTADGLDSDGNQPTFELRTNENWATKACPNWVKLNYTSGERGTRVMHLTVEPNETGEIRKGCIELSTSSSKAALIFVNQARVPGNLTVSQKTFSVNLLGEQANGKSISFFVESTYPWTIESSDWITATPSVGEGGKTEVILNVAINDTKENRTGRVTVTYGEEKADISITQDSKCFNITNSDIDIAIEGVNSPSGEALETEITSLENWTIFSKPDWINLNVNSGVAGTTSLEITALANEGSPRSGNIIIVSTHGIEATINVNQEGNLPFDNKEVGYCYFSEPFDWCHDAAEEQRLKDPTFADNMDQMNLIDGSGYNNLTMYNGDGLAYAQYFYASQKGKWELVKEYTGTDYVYILDGYVRIGASNQAIGLKTGVPLDIESDHCANVEVKFKACKNYKDNVNLVVEIEGPGTIVEGQNSKLSKVIELPNQTKGQTWVWQNHSVKIEKVSANTKIIIRPTVIASVGYQRRWFLDDVNVLRTAN
jgi:hypothetical protein